MRKRIFILVLVLAAAVAAAAGLRRAARRTPADPNVVRVSGNIEITDAELGFKLPGRVEAREVDEGQHVRVGQLIARLESLDLAREVALRRAELEVAQAALAELEAGTRVEEIQQAEAALAAAQAEAERAKLEQARQLGLREQSVNTLREYDAAEAAHKSAQARIREATARLAMLRQGPRREQLQQGRARLEQATQALHLAETRLGYATLTSPMAGLVLSKNVEPGEYVAPGTPVVTVGDLEHPWLRAYISETDLGRVTVGQKVRVTIDTFPGRVYAGVISFIGSQAEFTPKNVQTQKERVKLVYRVKVDLPNPAMELKPGMPADAEIQVSAAAEPGGDRRR